MMSSMFVDLSLGVHCIESTLLVVLDMNSLSIAVNVGWTACLARRSKT